MVNDPVLGAWNDDRLIGGVLVHTPDSPWWTDEQEVLTQEYGKTIDAGALERLLAFEAILVKNEPQLDVPYHYIDTIAVHPDFQGKGYARELVDHVVEMSRQHPTSGAVCLCTEAAENHGFYEHLCFEKVSAITLDTITSTSFKRYTFNGDL